MACELELWFGLINEIGKINYNSYRSENRNYLKFTYNATFILNLFVLKIIFNTLP